jgi:adenosine 3'-phospho 5'-phosphosulfate transporter B3
MMVLGLSLFIYADTKTDAPGSSSSSLGILMLVGSLAVDGVINNTNEHIMTANNVPQDDLLFAIYSLASLVMLAASAAAGELGAGLSFLLSPDPIAPGADRYASSAKLAILAGYVFTGFMGTSLSGAITKHFGALSMSLTSTARKAITLFLSFLIFPKACTAFHVLGMSLFMLALVLKSLISTRAKAPLLPR